MTNLRARRAAWACAAFAAASWLGGYGAFAQQGYFPAVSSHSKSRAGHGEFSLSYQFSHFNGGKTEPGIVDPIGVIDANAIYPQFDVSLTNRLSIQAGVPFFIVRYDGCCPHPNALDDGSYHSDVQDIQIGARYLLIDKAFKVEPYVLATIPSHHYTTFAHAAVGRRLHKGEIGAFVSYYPPFDDYYFSASLGRVFAEHPLGHNVDHWKSSVEAGYFLRPNFVVRAFLLSEQGHGLSRPEDFPPGDLELLHEHDRLFKNNFVEAGAGFDWFMDKSNRISVSALRMIEEEDSHILRYGVVFTLGHSF